MTQYTRIFSVLVMATALSACRSGMVEEGLVPSPEDVAAEKLETIVPNIDVLLHEALVGDQPNETLRDRLDGAPPLAVDVDRWHQARRLYAGRQYQSIFVAENQLTDAGRELLEVLRASGDHALWPSDYHLDSIEQWAAELQAAQEVIAYLQPLELSTIEHDALIVATAQDSALLEMDEPTLQLSLGELLFTNADAGSAVVPRVAGIYQSQLAARQSAQARGHDIETHLAIAFLRYAWDMRFHNPIWFEEDVRGNDQTLAEAQRLAAEQAFNEAAGGAGFAAVLEGLEPHFEQYDRLVNAHRRYRAIAANGGWPEVETVELRLGRTHDAVPGLRQRLAIEGYSVGDLESREFSREVRDALMEYQRTHQFRDNGRLSDGVVNSMNTTALERARQIAVTLDRWRDSQIGADDYYLFVNISDFHTEAWREGTREMRFRTIVGSTRRVERSGELILRHATPMLHETLRYVVFNPYWNVPESIMTDEYDPLLEENPKWYEHNGFEVLFNEDGVRRVRQLPGPRNALGEVKFLFPNEHDVYMHDTPGKRLFERPTRAFSHGCMRVENPLELAYYLVRNDRRWNEERIDEFRESGEEEWLTLRTPLAVHVEYYVSRVDDDGMAHFLADVYRYDRPLREARRLREEAEAIDVAGDMLNDVFETADGAVQRTAMAPSDDVAQAP